jgi:hypothetical protein
MRGLSGDVGMTTELIAPVFGISKTPAVQAAEPPEAGLWQRETERLFERVEGFERRASALFGDAGEPAMRAVPAGDTAVALVASAGEILREMEFLDHMITSASSNAHGRARSEVMRD